MGKLDSGREKLASGRHGAGEKGGGGKGSRGRGEGGRGRGRGSRGKVPVELDLVHHLANRGRESVKGELGVLVGQVRRMLSITAVRAQAECLLRRLRHVGVGRVQPIVGGRGQ